MLDMLESLAEMKGQIIGYKKGYKAGYDEGAKDATDLAVKKTLELCRVALKERIEYMRDVGMPMLSIDIEGALSEENLAAVWKESREDNV
jgi:hypothetical protein